MAAGDSLMTADALSNRPPLSGFATADLRGEFVVLDFDDAINEQAQFHAVVPSHYGGGDINIVLSWTTTSATSGNCRFRGELTRLTSGDNLDALPPVTGSSELVASAPSASGDLVSTVLGPITVSGLMAGETLQVLVTRLAADASDTLTGDVELVSLELREV